jgi:hypothetical protein
LIWDPGELRIGDSGWRADGPLLPVEYLRFSGLNAAPKRLTLVLTDRTNHPWADRDVRTLWARSAYDDLDDARANLARREQTLVDKIGYVVATRVQPFPQARFALTAIRDAVSQRGVLTEIENWLDQMGLDAAIWTDLPASSDANGTPLTAAAAVAFVEGLREKDRDAAEAYVRRTPTQVRTVVRESLERTLKWLPQFAPSPIRSADDLRFKDWAEARAAIGRFDSILVDVRKVGFSIATGLLAATTFLGFLGLPTPATLSTSGGGATTPSAWPIEARAAVWVALISLVVLLFLVDMYFEVLLSGAVERALDLEVQTDPPVRVTKYMSTNVHRVWGAKLVFYMYFGLLLLVVIFALLMLFFATEADRARAWWWIAPIAVGAVLFVWNYGKIGQGRTKQETLKARQWPEGDEKIGAPDLNSWRERP